jgi:hypothetical protein
MQCYRVLAFGMVCWVAAPLSAEPASVLAKPQEAQANVSASPKLDDRVFVYCAATLSSAVVEHIAGSQELVLDVGARDGVRFGHAFQIVAPSSGERIGIAKVIELQRQRCVAKLVYLDQDKAERSVKGFSAVRTAPMASKNGIVVQCAFGREIWQTESLENKLIRGLLESSGGKIQIVVREDNSDHAAE